MAHFILIACCTFHISAAKLKLLLTGLLMKTMCPDMMKNVEGNEMETLIKNYWNRTTTDVCPTLVKHPVDCVTCDQARALGNDEIITVW